MLGVKYFIIGGMNMIKKIEDYYRIYTKEEKQFDFHVIEIKESTHMWIVGTERRAKELHIAFKETGRNEEFFANLFDALKEVTRNGDIAKTFGSDVLEIVFNLNKRVKIHYTANNVRAEMGNRIAETVLFMHGKSVYEELDRLFMRMADRKETDLWICSGFEDD